MRGRQRSEGREKQYRKSGVSVDVVGSTANVDRKKEQRAKREKSAGRPNEQVLNSIENWNA